MRLEYKGISFEQTGSIEAAATATPSESTRQIITAEQGFATDTPSQGIVGMW